MTRGSATRHHSVITSEKHRLEPTRPGRAANPPPDGNFSGRARPKSDVHNVLTIFSTVPMMLRAGNPACKSSPRPE